MSLTVVFSTWHAPAPPPFFHWMDVPDPDDLPDRYILDGSNFALPDAECGAKFLFSKSDPVGHGDRVALWRRPGPSVPEGTPRAPGGQFIIRDMLVAPIACVRLPRLRGVPIVRGAFIVVIERTQFGAPRRVIQDGADFCAIHKCLGRPFGPPRLAWPSYPASEVQR